VAECSSHHCRLGRFTIGTFCVLWGCSFVSFGLASEVYARSSGRGERQIAEATPTSVAKRVVVGEGDSKTARLVNELEQELKASSYVVVHVPRVAFEPKTMLKTLQEAHAAQGILLSNDGRSVVVLAASNDGNTLRVYAEYSLDHENRLARRRQWISLVERLRVSAEDGENDAIADSGPTEAVVSNASVADSRTVTASTVKATASAIPATLERGERAADSLGASVALGYVSGRTGLTSHLLLTGYHPFSSHISLAAHVLWPMVQGEQSSDGIRSRAWTFIGAFGLTADLGRPSWRADPFVGATVGLQFLLAYVDHSEQAITDVYRVASLALDAQMGVRLLLRRETWLVLQVSGGRAVSLATQARAMTDSLADTWAVRTAVGLLMAL
jgi:hypothetical protein